MDPPLRCRAHYLRLVGLESIPVRDLLQQSWSIYSISRVHARVWQEPNVVGGLRSNLSGDVHVRGVRRGFRALVGKGSSGCLAGVGEEGGEGGYGVGVELR
jgi:hypothetical protein